MYTHMHTRTHAHTQQPTCLQALVLVGGGSSDAVEPSVDLDSHSTLVEGVVPFHRLVLGPRTSLLSSQTPNTSSTYKQKMAWYITRGSHDLSLAI